MQSPCSLMAFEDLLKDRAEMLTVVAFQHPTRHLSIIDIELDQEVDDTMPNVLKLLSFDFPRTHRLSCSGAFQSLDARLLIQAEDPFATSVQAGDLLITP
jgi:hypothetical protein